MASQMSSHEPIHSGHFMTSNPHTEVRDEEDEDVEVDVVEDDDKSTVDGEGIKKIYQEEKPVTFYKFGPKKTQSIAIDVSLNKLNKCIKVAYNKMTTPKWKDFKGLRLEWKQRIRLNNVIWRAYYMEFRKPGRSIKKPLGSTLGQKYCYFAVPDDDTTHSKIEGSILEGMYWKRRMEAVCAQYKRWRYFNKHRRNISTAVMQRNIALLKRKRDVSCSCEVNLMCGEPPPKSQTPHNLSTSNDYFYDDFENVFTDTLFDSLSQPYMFPNPREMMQHGNADILQPGLIPLQPSLEEIMASLDRDTEGVGSQRDSLSIGSQSVPPPSIPPPVTSVLHLHQPCVPSTSTATANGSGGVVGVGGVLGSGLGEYSIKDYAAANLLVDYSNQLGCVMSASQQPSRQPPSLTTQMLIQMSAATGSVSSSQSQPAYSQACYDQRTLWKTSALASPGALLASSRDMSNVDYMPQFLQHPSVGGGGGGHSGQQTAPARLQTTNLFPFDSASSSTAPSPVCERVPTRTGWWDAHPVPSSVGSAPPLLAPPPTLTPLVRVCGGGAVTGVPDVSLTQRLEQPLLLNNRSAVSGSVVKKCSSASSEDWKTRTPLEEKPAGGEWKSIGSPIFPQSSSLLDVKEEAAATPAPPVTGKHRGVSRQVPADSTLHPNERKRILHLHAEQNRRTALKDGFEQLMDQVPDLYSGGVKPTNAVVLSKAGDYIRSLSDSNTIADTRLAELKAHVARLNTKIASLQSNLPSGSRVSATSLDQKTQIEQFADRYTKEKARADWRYWLMSRLLQPMVSSYAQAMAATDPAKPEEVASHAAGWLRANWRVSELRPLASNTLVYLATNTQVLQDPASLQNHVAEQIKK